MSDMIDAGIPGLNDLFTPSGFPKGKTILMQGPPGAGKTIFCLQFLIRGALDHDEPGIFVAFDDLADHVRKDCRSFGWNLKELEAFDPPLITIVDGFSSRVGLTSNERFQIRANVDSLLITLLEVLDVTGATRVVIDSLTTLTTTVRSQPQLRKEILTMSAILGNRECTTLLTAEYRRQSSDSIVYAGSFSPEEYSTQGAIVVNYHEQRDGSYKRSVLIQKMRGHRHEFARKEFEITENGVLVHPDKNVGLDG